VTILRLNDNIDHQVRVIPVIAVIPVIEPSPPPLSHPRHIKSSPRFFSVIPAQAGISGRWHDCKIRIRRPSIRWGALARGWRGL